MNPDSLIVLFGATGDLSIKKILPALYTLFHQGYLKKSKILCVSRRSFTPKKLVNLSKKYIQVRENFSIDHFVSKILYLQHDFNDFESYDSLSQMILNIQHNERLINKVFYLSTSPRFYESILDNLQQHDLNEGKGFTRIVLEKPFGEDLKSALRINKKLLSVFKEDQIFRTDHYLAKNIVQDMIALRSTNRVFGPLWNKDNVDHIQIILSEDFGVETRGGFYDKYGALKDVVQNHIIQLLSITLARRLQHLTDESLRNEKVRILKNIIVKDAVIGQYQGYKSEKGVKKGSTTETLAALKVFVNLRQWKGVPIYILTGKHLQHKLSSVYIHFKKMDTSFLNEKNFDANSLTFQIQPNQGFYLKLNALNSHNDMITPVKMDFCNDCMFPNSLAAYTKLIKEVTEGDLFYFIRSDEVALQWKITDKILRKKLPLYTYKRGKVPMFVHDLIGKDGRSWKLDIEN